MRTGFFLFLLLPCCLPLRAGVSVQSITDHRTTEPSGNQLKITLQIQEAILETALDYHQVRVTRAEDDLGNSLILDPADDEAFRPLQVRPAEPHPITLMNVDLRSPGRRASVIRHLEGSCIVRTFRTQKIVIDRAFETFGRSIENSLLEAHGIEVQVINPRHAHPGVTDEDEIKRLMKTNLCIEVTGAANKIRGMELVDSQFKVIPSRSRHFGSATSAIWICSADQPLPEDTAIRLSIPIDPTEHKIEFKIEDIPLP
jgi:hypothetical protein